MAASGSGAARWVGAGVFANNQYSSLTLLDVHFGATARIGVLARASGDTDGARDYYFYRHEDSGDLAVLGKVVNGTETILDSRASAFAVNDRIELEVEGTTLRGMKNGTTLVTVIDSALATGNPGVMNEQTGQLFGDDWEGGDLTAAGVARLMAQGVM